MRFLLLEQYISSRTAQSRNFIISRSISHEHEFPRHVASTHNPAGKKKDARVCQRDSMRRGKITGKFVARGGCATGYGGPRAKERCARPRHRFTLHRRNLVRGIPLPARDGRAEGREGAETQKPGQICYIYHARAKLPA